MAGLDGRWSLRRTGGALPPLGLLHKRIGGPRGATHLTARVRVPFTVRRAEGRAELVYPLGIVRDRIAPAGPDRWEGETLVLGVRVGRFAMRRDEAAEERPGEGG